MIFVTDKGRLCNNILQYGHLYAWGREHGRQTMSMRFAHMYPQFHISHTKYHNTLVYVMAKMAAKCKLITTVDFNDINSDYAREQQIMLNKSHVLAKGWCVRFPDLFKKYKHEILQLFDFSNQVKASVSKKLLSPKDNRIRIGVHIRRGDYATWCRGTYFYNDEQYASVIQQVIELLPKEQIEIFICGNDPKLNRNYFLKSFGGTRVKFPDGSPAEDLCLLSQCDYLIGPPSTFTLVASMYHDTPLYWITDATKTLTLSDFKTFNYLFRHFDELYIP